MRGRAVAALAVAGAVACGGGGNDAPPPRYPQAQLAREATAADPLLAMAPEGANLVVEIDVARLRDNAVVGELFAAFTAEAPPQFAGLAGADVVVLVSYDVGDPEAGSLLIVRGGTAPDGAVRLDDTTAATGPPELVARVEALQGGHGGSVADDDKLMLLRDSAMPAKATSASVRVTARLDFDSRVGLSGMMDLDMVPSAISVWGDVVDDLAVVALLSGEEITDGKHLAELVKEWRSRAARHGVTEAWSVGYLLDRVQVEYTGNLARATFVVGPRALERVVQRLRRKLAVH
jgi:hypothetical protein